MLEAQNNSTFFLDSTINFKNSRRSGELCKNIPDAEAYDLEGSGVS